MTRRLVCTALAAVLAVSAGATVSAQSLSNNAKATLTGLEENPSISTTGSGTLDLRIDDVAQVIEFELRYDQLEGVAPLVTDGVVLAAHIHFSQTAVNGGVAAFLCGGGGKPACPTPSGTVTGQIVPGNIGGPAGQGLDPGGATTFAELVAAIRAGYTYVNVHTTRWPGGEIRGQIK
jgi:hypothetical protein